MRLEDVSGVLRPGADGIYFSEDDRGVISYAAAGHAECFGVEDGSFWFRHRNRCISAMVRRQGCEGTFLDVGGGNGYVAQQLQADGVDVVLLEPGIEGARNARLQRGLGQVACASLQSARFEAGTFAAAGLFDVIEHVEDDRAFLSAVRETLAPGGMVYMTVPCHQWLWSQADVAAGHFRRHTYDSIERMVDGLFRIEYMSYFFKPLVIPQYLLRALPYRLGIGRNRSMLSSEAEHGTGDGLATRVVNRLLRSEVRAVEEGRRMGLGASCLVAASRT